MPGLCPGKRYIPNPGAGTLGFSGSNYFCASFYDRFFVCFGGQLFRIDTSGDVKAFGYHPADYSSGTPINNMFTYGDTCIVRKNISSY